jgi:hypothetical protein
VWASGPLIADSISGIIQRTEAMDDGGPPKR